MKSLYNINSPKVNNSLHYKFNLIPEQFRNKDKKFISDHGYITKGEINGWLCLDSNVVDHSDEGGRCFVYCSSGIAVLTVDYRRPILLKRGEFCLFNDKDIHNLLLITPNVKLLIANVYKKRKCKKK